MFDCHNFHEAQKPQHFNQRILLQAVASLIEAAR